MSWKSYISFSSMYSMILNNRVDLNKRVDGKNHIMKLTENKIFEYLDSQAASPCIRDIIFVIYLIKKCQ